MSKPRHSFFMILTLFFTACASTHPGNLGESVAVPSKLPIKISAESIDPDKDSAFQLIDVTIENTSQAWLKINKTQVVINNPAESKISVVLGSDLKDWAQAEYLKQKQEQQNKEMAQLGVMGVGTVAALLGGYRGDTGLALAGTSIAVGTYGWAVADSIAADVNEAQRSEKIPDNHLYHTFSVAPKMYLRRWVLINKPVGRLLKNIVVEFETVEGEKGTYAISL